MTLSLPPWSKTKNIANAHIRRFAKNTRGSALVEFAISLPILLTLVFGVIEVARYVQANQKVTIAAYTISDIITQNMSLKESEVTALVATAPYLVQPFPSNEMVVIATSASKQEGGSVITDWQYSWPEGAGGSLISDGEGSPANISDFTFLDKDQVIAIEIFYTYYSLLGLQITDPFMDNTNFFYKYAFSRPRYGALLELEN